MFLLETVSLKLKPETSKRIALAVQAFDYGTKTEFIREAIRDKLDELEKQRFIDRLLALKGCMKGKSRFKNYEEWHEWRSGKGSEEFMELLEKELKDQK